MNLCRDCKWSDFEERYARSKELSCSKPLPDVVHGREGYMIAPNCLSHIMRFQGPCGIAGVYWEQRETTNAT